MAQLYARVLRLEVHMSKEKDVKLAQTESLFRGVNERIAETAEGLGTDELALSFVCECGDPGCTDPIHATLDEYEEVRTDGARFLMDEDHVDPEIERVAKRTRRFAIVEKVKPLVRRTAQRLDPRADHRRRR
jgi:hypothetical protein